MGADARIESSAGETTSTGNNGDPNGKNDKFFDEYDDRKEELRRIRSFLDDVRNELYDMLDSNKIQDIEEPFQPLINQYRDELKKTIDKRIEDAKSSLTMSSAESTFLLENLKREGLSGIELKFKLDLFDTAKGLLGRGKDWFVRNIIHGIMCSFLDSLSRSGVPVIGAIIEIKDTIKAVRKKIN